MANLVLEYLGYENEECREIMMMEMEAVQVGNLPIYMGVENASEWNENRVYVVELRGKYYQIGYYMPSLAIHNPEALEELYGNEERAIAELLDKGYRMLNKAILAELGVENEY